MLEVFGNEYDLQHCSPGAGQTEKRYEEFTVGRSWQVDWLLSVMSFSACEDPDGAELQYIAGGNFWIAGNNFTHFNQASVAETERLYQQLVADGLAVELKPLCDL